MEARTDHVELKGVTAGAMAMLLEFAYSGRLRLNLEDVMDALAGACHLQMGSAIQLCAQFLISEISSKTCIDILNIADTFVLTGVRDAALDFVIENFDKVIEHDQFMKMSRDHLKAVLRSSRLCIKSELELFHHVVRWVDFDRQERTVNVSEIFEHIRFAMMKPEELVDQVSQAHVMSDPKCRAFLDEALHYHVLPSRHPLMQTVRTQVRNEPCMVAFGGRYGLNIGYKHNCNKAFVLHDGHWLQLASSESNFLYAAVAVLDNFMYVCGGMGKPAHARATCQRFDPRTGTWTRIARMNTRRQSFPLVALNQKLYAFGGGSPLDLTLDHPPCDKCEVYSIDQNEWTSIAPLPQARKSAAACLHEGKIYVSGGRTTNETMMTFWCYDPVSDSWEEKSPMLLQHAGHVMMSALGNIYVIDRSNRSVECYNLSTDDWTKIVPPTGNLAGVARPAVNPPWVYFISFMEGEKDFRCRRQNVLTLEVEELPPFPEDVHCVISAPLSFPRHLLVDTNNNPWPLLIQIWLDELQVNVYFYRLEQF